MVAGVARKDLRDLGPLVAVVFVSLPGQGGLQNGFGKSDEQWYGCQRRSEFTMTTVNISLPDELRAFIEEQMAREGYASASEYIRDLIREAQRRNAKRELEVNLTEGLQGPSTKMTRKDWQSIEREALEGLRGETLLP